jgi:deazaflavin-dependent oxidoreductase (nitroreductase family)
MGWYHDLVTRMGRQRWFAEVGSRVAPTIDRYLYPLSNGRLLATGPPVAPTLLLTTIGRTSGKERVTPLLYVRDGDRLVVVGSNWGQARHPAWTSNLLADPKASVRVGRRRLRAVARPASSEERAALWPKFDAIWPGYANYRERASNREIRMFVLEPAA